MVEGGVWQEKKRAKEFGSEEPTSLMPTTAAAARATPYHTARHCKGNCTYLMILMKSQPPEPGTATAAAATMSPTVIMGKVNELKEIVRTSFCLHHRSDVDTSTKLEMYLKTQNYRIEISQPGQRRRPRQHLSRYNNSRRVHKVF